MKQQYHVFIDESGTLPDQKDRFIVIAGIGVNAIKEAENLVSRILKSLRQRNIKLKELKFYYAGERTRRQILSSIVSAELDIFIIATDKKGRKISDTPENFALLVGELIKEINLWQPKKELKIFIDRHFHKKSDEEKFNGFFRGRAIKHIDSQQNFIINLADFAAGAVLAKYNKNNAQFCDIIKEHILLEKIINWPELKRKSLINKKIPRTGASAHPRNLL